MNVDRDYFGQVLIVLDKHPAHCDIENLKMMLPDNFIVDYIPHTKNGQISQPMEAGIVAEFKRLYRRRVLRLLSQFSGSLEEFKSRFNLFDASIILAQAWTELPTECVEAAWRRTLLKGAGWKGGEPVVDTGAGLNAELLASSHILPITPELFAEWAEIDEHVSLQVGCRRLKSTFLCRKAAYVEEM